jgi:hypothetical protein
LTPPVQNRIENKWRRNGFAGAGAQQESPGHSNLSITGAYEGQQFHVWRRRGCPTNLDDVRELTEIAHDYGIATDYHINESPMIEQEHFKHYDNNSTYITREDWPKVDQLVDWIIEKNRQGYKMVNSIKRLNDMKDFLRGKVEPWNCRAGQNSIIIRTDGTVTPCFPMYSATQDWGTIENHKFDVGQLNENEKDLPDTLLLDTEPQPRFLLQR